MMTEADRLDATCLAELEYADGGGGSGGGAMAPPWHAAQHGGRGRGTTPLGRTPPELEERIGRFLESLRHLDAATGPPSPAAGSACGSGCGGSTVSLSPSDSVSCCCRPAAAGNSQTDGAAAGCDGGISGGGGVDTQSAADHALARQLRKLQLQGKAALQAQDARGPTAPCGQANSMRAPPGRLAPPAPAAACDALLHCSPSSAASCSGPAGGAVCGAAARDSPCTQDDGASEGGDLRPTTLCFGAAAAAGARDAPPRGAAPDGGAAGASPAAGGGAACRRGVFVGNLPGAITERALMALFSRQNLPVDCLWIARDPRNHLRSLGYGYVVFSRSDPLAHIRAARTLDGAPLDRQPVRVRPSDRDFDAFPLHTGGGDASSGGGSSGGGSAKAGQLAGGGAGPSHLQPAPAAAAGRLRGKQPPPGALRPLGGAVAAVAAAAAAAARREPQ